MRWVVGGKAPMDRAASANQMGRFETEWLAGPENLAALADLPGQWIDAVHQRRPPRTIVLDMDSSESPTYGEQEGSAYNGHFGCTCYNPLFVFNQLGDLERCALRPGKVHSAEGLARGSGAGRVALPGQVDAAVMPILRRECGPPPVARAGRQPGDFIRTLAMPKTAEPWSLTSLREKLIKIGAKVVSHGRYVTFQMAEVAVPRQMFQEILSLIARL